MFLTRLTALHFRSSSVNIRNKGVRLAYRHGLRKNSTARARLVALRVC